MKHYWILAVLALTTMIGITGCDEATSSKDPQTRVKLTLRTAPKGASVFIDGINVGEVTPLETILKDHHEHMVEIQAAGYEPKWLRIRSSYGEGNVDHDPGLIELREIKAPLILKSTPAGAFVNLNGEDLGKTPVYLKGVSPGEHTAVFRFAGHANMTKQITVKPDDLKVVEVSLSSITGTITVVTNPPEAEVFVDGERKGSSDANGRLVLNDIVEGRHSVKVVKAGFYDDKKSILVKANENTVMALPPLRPLPGELKVVSEPVGAQIYRDSMLVGVTPMVIKSLPAKEYTIKVELKGHVPVSKVVKVIPGMLKQVNFTMESMYGSAAFITKPSECTVVIDGIKKGTTEAGDAPGISKPLTIDNLKPGVHTVTFEKAGYQSRTKQILVNRGKETRVAPISLTKLWLATHILKTRGDMRTRRVKVLKNDGRHLDVEYKQGKELIRYQIKKSDISFIEEIK